MPFSSTAYRVLIASPSDVAEERQIVAKAIQNWTVENAAEYETVLIPITWETNVFPGIRRGGRPQAIVNEQIVDLCDVLVGVFWTRLGTPTGEAESGTAEEIQRFLDADKHVMLYFSEAPVVPSSIDPEQYAKLKAFKKECEPLGIVESYNDRSELSQMVARHLTYWLREEKRTASSEQPPSVVADEATPDTTKTDKIRLLLTQLGVFARRMRAEIATEQDSGADNIDVARRIVNQLASAMTEYYGALGQFFSDEDLEELQAGISAVKQQRENLRYITLGFDLDSVWTFGIELTKALQSYAERMVEKVE